MFSIPEILLTDTFRTIVRSDIQFGEIKHRSTLKRHRKITDGMIQLIVNTCDKFQNHQDYPIWNYVKLTRDYQKSLFPEGYNDFQGVLSKNGFVINHSYSFQVGKNKGKTKSVMIPFDKIETCEKYLREINRSRLNGDVFVDWNNPITIDGVELPKRIKVDTRTMYDFSNRIKDYSERLYNNLNLQLRLSEMDDEGFLIQNYSKSDFGRIIGQGVSSIQFTPKIILNQILKGCFDLDVNTCVYSILPVIYKRMTGKTPRTVCTERYVQDKSFIREDLSRSLGVGLDRVKECFTSMSFGMRDNTSSYFVNDRMVTPTLVEILGSVEKSIEFREHPFVKGLWDEMRILFSGLSKVSKGKIPIKGLRSPQRVSYLFQQEEVKVLKEMIRFVGHDLICPKHDSVILLNPLSNDRIEELQGIIHDKLGYRITLSQEMIGG